MHRKWEYKAAETATLAPPEQLTSVFGSKGWELVQIIERNGAYLHYFKREVVA